MNERLNTFFPPADDCFHQPVDYSVVPVVGTQLDNGFGVLTRLSVGSLSPDSDSSDLCFSRVALSDCISSVKCLWGRGGVEGFWCALMVSLREAVDARST